MIVAESAIHSRAQAAAAELAGADAVLVGTSLMRAADPGAKLRELVSRPLVKVCGLTRQEDVDAAVEAGADMLGFVFAEGSPRRAPAVLDVPETALSVAVFVGEAGGARRGSRPALSDDRRHRARPRRRPPRDGEDGRARARPAVGGRRSRALAQGRASFDGRVMLAGGLGPENVRDAIEAVRPWAVDAASSLETEPGIKDHAKVRAFVEAARG